MEAQDIVVKQLGLKDNNTIVIPNSVKCPMPHCTSHMVWDEDDKNWSCNGCGSILTNPNSVM